MEPTDPQVLSQQRVGIRLLRWFGYALLAIALVIGVFYGSQRSLAALEAEDARARNAALVAPAAGGNTMIAMTVQITSGDIQRTTPLTLRAGVAYQDRIAYWQTAIPVCSTDVATSSPLRTILASRESGEVILAVGPLSTDVATSAPADPRSVEGPVVWIDNQLFAVVHRKSVENLVEMESRQLDAVKFSETALGVHGEIVLRHAL